MSKVMEDMRNEVARETERRQITESVLRWLGMGLSHEQIAEGEGITLEQVREIAGMKGGVSGGRVQDHGRVGR